MQQKAKIFMSFATAIPHQEISPKGIIQQKQEGMCSKNIQCSIIYSTINVQQQGKAY